MARHHNGTGWSVSPSGSTAYAEAADELREKDRFYEAFETPTELDLKAQEAAEHGAAAGL